MAQYSLCCRYCMYHSRPPGAAQNLWLHCLSYIQKSINLLIQLEN